MCFFSSLKKSIFAPSTMTQNINRTFVMAQFPSKIEIIEQKKKKNDESRSDDGDGNKHSPFKCHSPK